MNKIVRSVSGLLAVVFIMTSTILAYPTNAYAAKTQNGGKENKEIKIVDQNRDKTEIIVKYKSSGKQKNVVSNIKGKQKLSKFDIKKSFKNSRVDLFEIDKSDDMEKTIAALKQDPDVEYAQPNYKLTVTSMPTDARFPEQWGLSNSGQEIEGNAGRSGVDINAVNAWDLVQQPTGVVIGVLDTGIDISHEDLRDNIFVNTGEIAGNNLDDDNNGYVDDVNGWDFVNNDNTVYDSSSLELHGTQVAGVISSAANSTGVIGVAPNAKLMPLKFINGNWGYTCDAIDAIEYAMAKGVKIINCSFGGTDNNFALKDTMANSGILFVCSGGNRGADVSVSPVYPACFDIPNVLSVASIDSMGVISPYSSYGDKIHVAAPGINILTTTPDNTYGYFSGTSASAPFAAGVAALLKSYLPALSITDIAARITDNTVPCTNLAGKVSSGGRIDAFAALSNTKPQLDNYTGPGNDNSTVPAGQQGGNEDTWYTQDQLAKIKEKLHYGESGVNPASGNFSFTVNDMSVPAPGFQVNISRTYNSRDGKSTPMGQGWTFGFEGRVEGTDVINVTLPNGGSQRFRLSNGVYTPEDNRSIFVKNTDGTYLLTTKDQYRYTFNTNGYLTGMTDRNGNTLSIQVDTEGRISSITDTVGRAYSVTYNSQGLISQVTDTESRQVAYEYDTGNRLVKVTDPKGGIMRYSYDSWGFINEIQDHDNNVVEKLTYNHTEGENQHKVSQATDALGDLVNYSYDMTNKKTTITDMNGRASTYWFDKAMYTIQVQDPEGKSAYTEYYMPGGTNKYGDVKSTTDRYGNKTLYDVDSNGNVIKVTNPDGSARLFEYDDKNNLTKETDEAGRLTYYVYDPDKRNLVKTVRPLDGTTPYTGTDGPGYAITVYSYYTGSESGCAALKLLNSKTDPEGDITTYTYDADGNIKTVSDPQTGEVTTYEYNRVGWKTACITPEGHRTEYGYDKNGQLIKITAVSSRNETTRMVYNLLGQKIQGISPNQYNFENDSLSTDTYSDNTVGTRYTYYDTGKLESTTDASGSITGYNYDVYGNVTQVTRPNGSIYRYEYDVMDRPVKEYFKENQTGGENLLKEYSYADMGDGKTQKTETQYLNAGEKAVMVLIYDFANRLIERQNPDGTKEKMTYYADGALAASTARNGGTIYCKYNGLGLLAEQWIPLEVSNGDTYYSYKKTEYYKNGWRYKEISGKDKVPLYGIPVNQTIKTYEYYKNGKLKKITDQEGRMTEYLYDSDGNVTKEDIYTDAVNMLTTEYTYNYLEKIETKIQHVNKGDLAGNSFGSAEDTSLTTSYTYDKNGNISTIQTPDQVVTTYGYDVLDRQTSSSKPGLDETGAQVTISTSTAYNWEGKPLTTTDANGSTTTYAYSPVGLLTHTTDALGGVTLYSYDIAGRKTAEVSPENYDGSKSLTEMSRVEYVYDLMGRVKAKKNVYYDDTANHWVTITSKAYQYDNSGNVVKELDALGYDSGSGASVDEKISTGYGTIYTYNLAGKLSTVTDPVSKERALSFTAKYEYDGLGRKVSEINAKGVITTYEYDNAGNILSTGIKKDADAQIQVLQTNAYDLAGRLLSKTDGNGNTVTYEYNAFNQIRKTVTPGDASIPSNATTYQYDEMGRLSRQADSTGLVELCSYDSLGRQLSRTRQNANGTQSITTSTKYDKNGNVRFETDGNGNQTEKTYDSLNRLKTTFITVNGMNKVTTYWYDADGNQTTVTDWLGNTSTNVYDPMGRLIEKYDPYTMIQRLEYNKNGAQVKSYDALNNVTQYIYDKNNRLIATVDPEGHTTSQYYDDAGNIISKTDGRNISTTYNYDEFNRLQSVVNAKSETTGYTYDLNGNMLTQTDGNSKTTSFEYNAAGMLMRKIDHGGKAGSAYIGAKTESYSYYANGNLLSVTDRNGTETIYTYDVFGRLLTQTAGTASISYTYDNNGNQLIMADSTGTTTRVYDSQNRVTSKTVPVIGETIYTYDGIETGGMYSETTADPKGNTTKKVYDKAGRLANVIAGNDTTTYTYYANGSQKSVEYTDGAKEEYTYDADGLVRTLTNKNADGTVMESYSYTYDGAHNQVSKVDSKGTTVYSYDSLERLESTTEPNGRVTGYTFDKTGNRLTETVTIGTSAAITTYTYNEQNRLVDTVTNDGSTTVTVNYAYDNNGNMVSKSTETTKPVDPEATGSFSLYKAGTSIESAIVLYKYDNWNQLAEVITCDKTEKYRYNGEGYRVVKNDNGQLTNYLYEYDKVILETDDTGTQTARNVYGINLISMTSGSETLHYMYNGHADVTTLIDNTGAVKASYYYDAFGNILDQTGSADNNITYAGYQYDEETGLYYLNARYYDSKIARFLSEDTYRGSASDPLNLNLYTYCHNEPIMYWDPTGHWEQGDEDLNDEAKARIIAITNAYYEATTAAEREAIHNQAVSIRNDQSSYRPKVTPLTIEAHDAITNAVNQGVAARGYMTKDEWVNAINSDGITYTTDISYDVSSVDVKKDSNTVTTIGRTAIGVHVNSSLMSQTASASMSLTYNLSYNEATFVNSVISSYDYSLEQSICLLDIMDLNGEITDSDLQNIVGNNYYTPKKWYEKLFDGLGTADMLELEYSTTHFGYTTAEIDYMMTKERLIQAYNLVCFQALCAASNANVSIGPRDAGYYYVNGKKVYYESPSGYLFESGATFAPHGSYINITANGYSIVNQGADKNVDSFIRNNVNPNFQQNVKNAFGSDVKITTLTSDKTVYRYSGGTSGGSSYWVTPNKTANPAVDLALPPGNTYNQVNTYVIPKGTTILEGTVAPNFGQPGGGYQYYVPDPSVMILK
ncbi:MAG: S8 family serine peptidase [Clostridiaceae bacterium]